MSITYRKALLAEIPVLKALLWEFGPNEWNYLTHQGVDEEFALVESGHAQAFIALSDSIIIGFAVLIDGTHSPNYLEKYARMTDVKFVGDVVVSSLHAGKGIATRLLKECITEAKNTGANSLFIERHEENRASAGMMRKAGFNILDVFHDPEKRFSGSRNSVILDIKI